MQCETCQYELHFVVCFSSEKVLQNLPKNNRTKKQIDAEIQVTLKRAPARKRTEDKMFCRLSQQITKLNYKLTLLASECLFHKFCYLNYLLVLLFQSNQDNLYQVKRYILVRVVAWTCICLLWRFHFYDFILVALLSTFPSSCFNLFFLLSILKWLLGCRGVFKTQSNICDGTFYKNSYRRSAVN